MQLHKEPTAAAQECQTLDGVDPHANERRLHGFSPSLSLSHSLRTRRRKARPFSPPWSCSFSLFANFTVYFIPKLTTFFFLALNLFIYFFKIRRCSYQERINDPVFCVISVSLCMRRCLSPLLHIQCTRMRDQSRIHFYFAPKLNFLQKGFSSLQLTLLLS